jgi:Zn-finger nucleic acid-binding protein
MLEAASLDASDFTMKHVLALPEKRINEGKRKCPLCRKKMRKVAIGKEPEVILDACPREEGLWFDGGEVGQVIKQLLNKPSAKAGHQETMVSFLGEVFKAGK